MASERLPVAVIGVGVFGNLTLQSLLASDQVQVVGVADRDAALAERAGQTAGVPAYSDNRSLLAETRPRAAFVTVPPPVAPEIIGLCAERGVHVWKELPLARSLVEGVALINRMEQAGLKFAVGTQRRFSPGYQKARQCLPRLGDVFLTRAHYLFNWGPNLGWRGDRGSSGGGVLMEVGYHLIDLLAWMFALPEEAYGVASIIGHTEHRAGDGKLLPPHDTDDSAAAILRYAGGMTASLAASRCWGPVSEELALHGREGSIVANSESCVVRDCDGKILEQYQDASSPRDTFRRQVESFARAVSQDSPQYECSARENLLNLAVAEAIYLSNRTNQPEHPLRLLQQQGLTGEQCLLCRPQP